MADLSKLMERDPTLEAADRALEEKEAQEKPRAYIGMSSIGSACARKLWYIFRLAGRERFDAATLKRFSDGHRTEALIIDRLRLLDGITLIDRRQDGNQIGYVDLDGHFRGHLDGDISGILQAPKTPHVFEAKTCSDKKMNELKKAIADVGEKNALRKWNPVYYTQGMLYCHYHNRTRHYLVVATPGGRDWIGVRTDHDEAHALQAKARAKRIIAAVEPPERISDDSSYFECRWCSFSGICHKEEMPDRSCRTCLHISPVEEGQWHCARFGKRLTFDEQISGCPAHCFIPALVPAEVIRTTDDGIYYKLHNGEEWYDGEVK